MPARRRSCKVRRLVLGEGPEPADVMVVGQAPGYYENLEERPFVGKSGRLLDIALRRAAHISRSDCYVSNLYKIWPGVDEKTGEDLAPTPEEIASQLPIFEDELERVNPRVVVAVGRLAARYFLPDTVMESDHGIPQQVGGRVVIPCYHPSAALRDEDAAACFWYDLRIAGEVIKGSLGVAIRSTPTFAFSEVGANEANQVLDVEPSRVGVDTEGTREAPYCLSFSLDGVTGYVVKDARGVDFSRHVMILHNSLWDLPVLDTLGVRYRAFEDPMIKAYLLQVEPQALKDLVKRYTGLDSPSFADLLEPHYFEAVHAYLDEALKHEWLKPEEAPVQDKSKWKLYKPQSLTTRLTKIRNALGHHTSSSLRRWWFNVSAEVREPCEYLLGPFPEEDCRLIPAAELDPYAAKDACFAWSINQALDTRVKEMGLEEVYQIDLGIVPMVRRMMDVGIKVDTAHFDRLQPQLRKEMDEIEADVNRRYAREPVSLRSPKGTAHLLYRVCGLRPPRLTESGQGSTDAKALEALRGQHPVVSDIRRYRTVAKLEEFARLLPAYRQEDGRVRGRVKTTRVVSGRLSMEDPNMMAIPVRTEGGKEIRNGFVAEDGRVLASWDYEQIEMKIMAHLSSDPVLCDRIRKGDDIHMATACDIFGKKAADVTKEERYAAKRIGFGVITGIQGPGLLDQMLLAGIRRYSVRDCNRFIGEWFRIYPAVNEFLEACRDEARRHGYVRDMWGRIRYLPLVFHPDAWRAAEAERQSHSHKISASAQNLLKRGMARIWTKLPKVKGYCEPLLQIHDELLFEHNEGLDLGKQFADLLCADQDLFSVPITSSYGTGKRWGELK